VQTNERILLISLVEPVRILKNGFKEHVVNIIDNSDTLETKRFIPVKYILEYNCTQFFKELFNDDLRPTNDRIECSIKVLINDGMDEEDAKILAIRVYRIVSMILAPYIPNGSLDEDGYRCSFNGSQDLLLSPPYREWLCELRQLELE